jgi:cephalosporin hydroxylase
VQVAEKFHERYYDSQVWKDTYWLGVPTQKCPLDLWVYQELLFELRPDLIIETGTADGGSALYLASICDLLGRGRVITIDVLADERPTHPRVQYLVGSSTDPVIVDVVRGEAAGSGTVFVVLDSDHTEAHVLDELRAYAPLVTNGSYVVVEDTNINGHPVLPEFGPGPAEAVDRFLTEAECFGRDPRREKFGMTFNPGGYLRRVEGD